MKNFFWSLVYLIYNIIYHAIEFIYKLIPIKVYLNLDFYKNLFIRIVFVND